MTGEPGKSGKEAHVPRESRRCRATFTGEGPAGVDLHRIVAGGPGYVAQFLPALTATFLAIFDHPGPVLAASRLVLTAELLGPAQAQAIGLIHDIAEPSVLVDSVVHQAQRLAQIPAGVFSFSKRQLQQPARDRIAARRGDDTEVLATWSSAATQTAITGYLDQLKHRPR